MGRKIELKKIEDNKKSQVTFSKRRTSLIKKAQQISVNCDVDVAFLAFSSSGRISKFCNRKRMEDLIDRYVNQPVEKRLSHVKSVQDKMKTMQELGHIRNEDGKLRHLNDQIENLELQMKRNEIETQLAEADLRDFELNWEQEASLHQLSWCERNLQQSIEKVKEKKEEKLAMESEGGMPWLYNDDGNSLLFAGSSSSKGQHKMQYESWRNNQHSSASVPKSLFNEMLGKGKGKVVADAYGASETRMHQLGFPIIPETLTMPSYNSLQQNYRLWKQAMVPWLQVESNSSFGNFTSESSNLITHDFLSDHTYAFRESSNHVPNSSADANNYWEISMLQNRPNRFYNNIDMEANDNNKKENHDTYNEMIVSPPPSVEAPPSTSRVSIRLYDFFPSKGSFGRQCTDDSED